MEGDKAANDGTSTDKLRHDIDEENSLSERLKHCCDSDGKEIDVVESAKILHELRKIYRRKSPDKISLIRSIGLFNAAIVRKPENIENVLKDLQETCSEVLKQANAKRLNSNLVIKSKTFKKSVKNMRKTVTKQLSKIKTFSSNSWR